MDAGGNQKGNRTLLYAAVALISGAAALVGKLYPGIDLSFRLALPLVAFAWIVHYFRESLRSLWLWVTILPLFAAHWLLVAVFLPTIRQLNMWVWVFLVIVELLIVGVAVASASPEARAERSRRKQDVLR